MVTSQITNTENQLILGTSHQTIADTTEIPGTSRASQDHCSNDLNVSTIRKNSLNSDEFETELDLKLNEVQNYIIAIPDEEKGITSFLDSCQEAFVLNIDAKTQKLRHGTKKRYVCDVS